MLQEMKLEDALKKFLQGKKVLVMYDETREADKSLRKESKVVQTKKQYGDFSLTALSFASISIFSG